MLFLDCNPTDSLAIGIIGYGSIGKELVELLSRNNPDLEFVVLVRPNGVPSRDVTKASFVCSLEALLAKRPLLVVEAAGQGAVKDFVPALLAAGVPVLIGSVGSLACEALLQTCVESARKGGGRIALPSGAIGGLDYLGAARFDSDAVVEYTSRKPVAAWKTELAALGIDADTLETQYLFFEGDAKTAARLYPRNLNVAATIALAGVGMERTRVRVVADPGIRENTHEIRVKSRFGSACISLENLPLDSNPKTSALTVASLAHAVKQMLASVKNWQLSPDR